MADGVIGRRGRNALQAEQRQRTRALILAAATELFNERGYSETSIAPILARAAVSRAAFYAHFDSKLALICAIAEEFKPTWRPVFAHLVTLRTPSLAALEDWATRYLAFHQDYRAVCGVLTQVTSLEERLYQEISAQRDALIAYLGTRYPAFAAAAHDADARLRARLLLWQMDQTCFFVVHGRTPDPGQGAPRLIAEQLYSFLQRHSR